MSAAEYRRNMSAFSITHHSAFAHPHCGQRRKPPRPQLSSAIFRPGELLSQYVGGRSPSAEIWTSEGSDGIPDGTEVDASYAQWHSDGTEMQVSGMRAPLTGDVCLGVWIKTGARTYRLNHFGASCDSTGQNLIGPARVQA